MQVHFRCGYYSELAHKSLKRRPEDYWDAYFYTWAVKVGSWKKDFYIHHDDGKTLVTKKNFSIVRESFGQLLEDSAKLADAPKDVVFVPVPSKDGVKGAKTSRALDMVNEALNYTRHKGAINDGLRWKKALTKAHLGGSRSRTMLAVLLSVDESLKGKNIILVDDLLTTGASLLAAKDRLHATGAKVICAVVCGRTIYDFKTPNFGQQVFSLKKELHDFDAALADRKD